MNNFVNEQHAFSIEDYLDSYLKKKPADCVLYSEDGSEFKIHKEMLGQTEFLRQILRSAEEQCCTMIEIFCPCKTEDLKHLVQFLYDGEIHCENENDSHLIFDNLNKIMWSVEDCTHNLENLLQFRRYWRLSFQRI